MKDDRQPAPPAAAAAAPAPAPCAPLPLQSNTATAGRWPPAAHPAPPHTHACGCGRRPLRGVPRPSLARRNARRRGHVRTSAIAVAARPPVDQRPPRSIRPQGGDWGANNGRRMPATHQARLTREGERTNEDDGRRRRTPAAPASVRPPSIPKCPPPSIKSGLKIASVGSTQRRSTLPKEEAKIAPHAQTKPHNKERTKQTNKHIQTTTISSRRRDERGAGCLLGGILYSSGGDRHAETCSGEIEIRDGFEGACPSSSSDLYLGSFDSRRWCVFWASQGPPFEGVRAGTKNGTLICRGRFDLAERTSEGCVST